MIVDIPASFTLNDIISRIRQEKPEKGAYRTTREWMAKFDVSEDRMNKVLRDAQAAGILLVSKAKRPCIDGAMRWIPVYALDVSDQEGGDAIMDR